MFPMFYFLSLYMQQVLGYPAIKTGLAFLVVATGMIASSGLAQAPVTRAGVRVVLAAGMLAFAAAQVLFIRLPAATSFTRDLLPGFLLVAAALGLAVVGDFIAAAIDVKPADAAGLRPDQHHPAGRRRSRPRRSLRHRRRPHRRPAARRPPARRRAHRRIPLRLRRHRRTRPRRRRRHGRVHARARPQPPRDIRPAIQCWRARECRGAAKAPRQRRPSVTPGPACLRSSAPPSVARRMRHVILPTDRSACARPLVRLGWDAEAKTVARRDSTAASGTLDAVHHNQRGAAAVTEMVKPASPPWDSDESDGPMTVAGRPPSSPPARPRPEFDVLRAFVVAGLVVFHSAVVFAAGASWFVKDPRPRPGFTVFLLWGSLWGMPLLFVVSGMGARYAMRTRPAAAFVRGRLARLLVPFAVSLAVLVPPMFYLERLGQPAFHESYWRFWLSFVNVPALARGLLLRGSWRSGGASFDPAHLWFLYVLLVFSITLLPLLACLRGPRGTPFTGRLAGFAERHGAVVVFAAAIPMMGVEAVFGPDVNTGGWERLAYVFPFLYGFLIACDPRLEAALRRSRRLALAVACAATATLAAWAGALSTRGAGLSAGVPPAWGALQGLAGWAWIAAIMGFAGSLAARRGSQPAVTSAPACGGARAVVAPRRPVRERGRTALLPAARAGHRGNCLAHRPLARANPREVRRAGHRVLRRDFRPVRDTGPPVPRHPAAVRHEARTKPSGERPRS